jgi:hypothetical protein
LTVQLAAPALVNRVIVDTQSAGSTAAGLRDYSIEVLRPGGRWVTVAEVRGEFRYHVEELAFTAVLTQSIRVTELSANYGGYAGGGLPSFWPSKQSTSALVHSVQVYSGSGAPSAADGNGLSALPSARPDG